MAEAKVVEYFRINKKGSVVWTKAEALKVYAKYLENYKYDGRTPEEIFNEFLSYGDLVKVDEHGRW